MRKRSELEKDAYLAIMKVARRFNELNKEDTRPFDVSPQQYSVLRHATREGTPITEISNQMLADNSSLTRVIDRMEGRGLVERSTDATDRRLCLVRLTEDGDRLARKIIPLRARSISRRFGNLTNAQLGSIIESLSSLCEPDVKE